MAAAPSKSRQLHNFSFPELGWVKNSSSSGRRESFDHPPAFTKTSPRNDAEEGENGEEGKPWNLRPRRGAAKAAAVSKNENLSGFYDNCGNSKKDEAANVVKSERATGVSLKGRKHNGVGLERKEKTRLWISLSREEIEEDIYSLTGSRPARRPRKWPKNVQKHLDSVFPGLYLVGVAADSYVVHDDPK